MSKSTLFGATFLISLVASTPSHSELFLDTPLQPAYQATLNQQPQLAWQELTLALSQHELDDQLWLPVKQEVLHQTDCGSALSGGTANNLRLSFVKRFGTTAKGYQVRISTENSPSAMDVTLFTPDGSPLVSGQFAAGQSYQEFESIELLQKPRSGVFNLVIDEQTIGLVIAIEDQSQWLVFNQQRAIPTVELNLPQTLPGCPSVSASWQWFDSDYRMLGHKIAFQQNPQPIPANSPYQTQAKHLSASVERVEFQHGVRIEYIQRIAIPYQ